MTESTGTAFVFPGQGSQYPGMVRELAVCSPHAAPMLTEAEERTGLPVRELMARADASRIADPEIAQVLVFVSSCIQLRALADEGWRPSVVAGHSLGEYSALVAAGCLDWTDALDLVAVRGRAMAEAARRCPGGMAAVVGLPLSRLRDLCADVALAAPESTVVVANVNSARQAVVSGTVTAVDAVVEAAAAAGALRAKRLPVGGAYHTPLMEPAEQVLAPRLRAAALAEPEVPLVSSVDGEPVTDLDRYREQLLRQVTSPVQWHATLLTLAELRLPTFVEVGPGRVLSGLGRETVRASRHLTTLEALRGGRIAPQQAAQPVPAAHSPGKVPTP